MDIIGRILLYLSALDLAYCPLTFPNQLNILIIVYSTARSLSVWCRRESGSVTFAAGLALLSKSF